MPAKLEIAIAGAGIAGLAAAAFLARDGHRVRIFDRFPAPAPVGSGLMIQPVGFAVLEALGLAAPFVARAAPVRRLFGRSAPRDSIVLDVRYRHGAVGYGVQRAALFDLLLEAAVAAGAELVPGTEISTAEGSTLFAGSKALGPFDLIVDALGYASPLSPKPARALPYGALWGLIDWPERGPFDVGALEQRYRRAAQMVGVLPVGRLTPDAPDRMTFFWSLRADQLEAWRAMPLETWKAEVAGLWADVMPLLPAIQSHADLAFARYGHRTVAHPVTDRTVHLGDSYHANSPQLGQGANMALLDAAALWQAVATRADPPAMRADYARRRRWHTWIYQASGRIFTPVYQSDSRILPWLRDQLASPLSRIWPMPGLLAALVSGEIGDPLATCLPPAPTASPRRGTP